MRKTLKLLISLATLIVIVLLATVITLASLDPNEHKDWIAKKVKERTGRVLSLDGDIAVSFYPWLGLQGNQIRLGQAPGFGDDAFMRVDHVELRVKLLPLLSNQYEIDTINIKGAVINLARDEQGKSNWDDLVGGPEERSDGPALPLAAMALGGVAIENARITWQDRKTGVRADISELNAAIAELKYGEPLALSLGFHAVSNRPAVDARVDLKGVMTYDTDSEQYGISPLEVSSSIKGKHIPGGRTTATLSAHIHVDRDAQTASIAGISIDALNTTLTGRIKASRLDSPTPSINTALAIKGDDLARLFKIAEIEPLASQLSRLKRRDFQAQITMDADLERGDIDVSEFSAQVLGAAITGEVKARHVQSDTPAYQGRLNATGPDLPMLMQVMGQLQGGDKAALTVYGRALAKNPDRAFSLKADVDADLKSGDISLPLFSVTALGIDATAALQARNMKGDNGNISGEVHLKGETLPALLRALGQEGLSEVVEAVELTTKVQGTGAAVQLAPVSVNAVLAGKGIAGSPINISLDASASLNLKAETLALNKVTVAGLDLQLVGSLNAKSIMTAPEFSGEVNVQPFNLRKIMQRLGQPLPPAADKTTWTNVALSTQFEGSEAFIHFNQASFQLDDSNLTGKFRAADLKEKPAMEFNLNIDSINLDRYLPPQGAAGRTTPSANNITPQSPPAEIPIERLRGLALQGEVSIGELIVKKATLRNVGSRFNAEDGVLHVQSLLADLYEGKLTGEIKLDVNPALPGLTVSSTLQGVQAEPLLRDVKGKARLRGRGEFSAALSTEGRNSEEMRRNLNGQMRLHFSDGAITGFNLGRKLRQWKQFKKGGSTERVDETEATDFLVLTGNPVAKAGVIRMDDLSMKAPLFRLAGEGELANLHADTIDYRLLASIANTAKGAGGKELVDLAGLDLPVNISGSLAEPKIRLDWGGVLAGLLTHKLKDAISLPIPGAGEPAEKTDPEQEDLPPASVEDLLFEGLKGLIKNK